MEPIKKITVKTVTGGIKREKVNEIGEHDVMHVIGRITSTQTKETQYGPYVEFKGSFEATNLADNKQYWASKLLCPEVMQDILAMPFMADQPPANLDFAFVIGVKPSDSTVGYEFTCRPIVEQETAADPLAEIRKKALESLPKPDTKSEEKPADKKEGSK